MLGKSIPDWLQSLLGKAKQRWWQATLLHHLGRWLLAVAILFLIWSLAALIWPVTATLLPLALAIIGFSFAASLLTIYTQAPPDHRILAMVDQRLDLPDEMLSAGELDETSSLARMQHAIAEQHTRKIDWRQAWPVRPARYFNIAIVAVVLLGSMLGYTSWVEGLANHMTPPPNKVAVRATAFEEVLEDWEKAAEFDEAAEFEEFAEKLRPMIEQMKEGDMTEREVALELASLEQQMKAKQEALEQTSWDDLTSEMAEAAENIEGLSGMAAALRQQDYERASKEANEAAKKLDQQKRPAVSKNNAEKTAQQLGELGKRMQRRGNQPMAGAMSQMQQGAKQQSNQKMAKGLQQMRQGMQQQGKQQSKSRSLSKGLAQLGKMKEMNAKGMGMMPGLGKGQGLMVMMPGQGQQPGGQEAGTGQGSQPGGPETSLDANRETVQLSGIKGEGESEVTTMESQEGSASQVASGKSASFAEYEKLSFEAINNENLPLSHREVIRRYFQGIRPTQER